ncbi:MAG: hypothetical protein LCH32_07395 [Bacteroidetes bacterium]|nr:hypothetical protein [Bacteroidota bacterium]
MKSKADILFDKIHEGILKAYHKLLIEKAKNDEELIFSIDNKIVRIKAKKLLEDNKEKSKHK